MLEIKGGSSKGSNLNIDKCLRKVEEEFRVLIQDLEEGYSYSNRDLEREIFILKKELKRIREYIEEIRICKDN
jgi:hypothetical protein